MNLNSTVGNPEKFKFLDESHLLMKQLRNVNKEKWENLRLKNHNFMNHYKRNSKVYLDSKNEYFDTINLYNIYDELKDIKHESLIAKIHGNDHRKHSLNENLTQILNESESPPLKRKFKYSMKQILFK